MGCYAQASRFIFESLKVRQDIARSFIQQQPVLVSKYGLQINQILEYQSEFHNYCPVSIKLDSQFRLNSYRNPYLVLFDYKLYNICSLKYYEEFCKNPIHYINKGNLGFANRGASQVPVTLNFVEFDQQQLRLNGFDAVDFIEKNQLVPGLKHLIVKVSNQVYLFSSEQNLLKFNSSPHIYSHA